MIKLPSPKKFALSQRSNLIVEFSKILNENQVITSENQMRAFETDGLSAYRQMPMLVVLPETTEQVAALMQICNEAGVRIIPRGAGTSLSGGALPLEDAVIIGLSKMNEILDINLTNQTMCVQAGVTNINISNAVDGDGYFYAPDPSSQIACTIAGNLAMNSGGAHCLKYGVTTNNLLGIKFVTLDGQIHQIGGEAFDAPSLDMLGLICGSEGTLGIATEITVRILPRAEGARPLLAGFGDAESAGACVAAIRASGTLPVAIEFMDRPAIHAAENFTKAGYPLDCEALLIIEVEGSETEISAQLETIEKFVLDFGATSVEVADSYVSAETIWKGRKSAFGAIGQISPDYICMDGTIPVSKLPEVLNTISAIVRRHGLDVANIFHAGDGNMHPLILYNANEPGSLERVEEAGAEILQACVDVGGCLTGEHGVGIEKRDLMHLQFTATDLNQQRLIKSAFDPDWLLNPAKVFPLDSDGELIAPKLEIAA